jgi:hypothetical protein
MRSGRPSITAADGSRLAISVSVSTDDLDLFERRARFQTAVAAVGEPARTVLSAGDAEALFNETGWQCMATTSQERARRAGLLIATPA